MNDTQENQKTYTYFEHKNLQQSRNEDDNDGEYVNPFHRQCNYELNLPSSSFKSKKEKKRPRSMRRLSLIPEPPLGAPGGIDDPNRAGLRGPQLRWYWRFLNQGFSANESIRKTRRKIEYRKQKKKLRETARATATATFAASSELYEDSLSSASSSSNMQSFKTALNPETSGNDLLKLAKESGRNLQECLDYCRLYQFKGNAKKLFKHLYHEQGLGLEFSLQKTLEASKRKIHKGMDIACIKYGIEGAYKNRFFRLVRENGFTVKEAAIIVQKQIAETALLVKERRNNSEYNKTNREFKAVATQHTKYDTNGAPIANCEDLQLRVALLPKNYPQHKLDEEALRLLEDAVIEEVARGWEANLEFKAINFGSGVLLVDCGNTETAQWLTFVTPQLNAWSGVDLIACLQDDLPMPHTASMYLLSGAGQSVTTSLALFNSQNAGLNTKVWKLLDCRNEGYDQRITFGIDQTSFDTISANGNIIHYGFGTIPVQINGGSYN